MKQHLSVKTLASSAVLIALNIVITRLLSVNIGPVRIGLGFLPIALGAMLYGPVTGTVIAVVADVLGAILSGTGYWPGFGLSAALYGITYAFFLYKKEKSYKAICVCAVCQGIFIDALLGAFWYYHYAGMAFFAALWGRSINAFIMIFVKIILIKYTWQYIGAKIEQTKHSF